MCSHVRTGLFALMLLAAAGLSVSGATPCETLPPGAAVSPEHTGDKAPDTWFCPGDSVFGQPPVTDDSGGVTLTTSSDGSGLKAFEYYSGLSFPPSYITWWGVRAENAGGSLAPCAPDPNAVEIIFYSDACGIPGDAVAIQSGNYSGANTGVTLGGFPLYRYRADVSLRVRQSAGWVSIEGFFDTDCWFFWAPSEVGNGTSMLLSGATYNTWDTDLAVCLEEDSLDCPAGTTVSQAPHGPLGVYGSAVSDESALIMCYETFAGVTEPIVAVRVWGVTSDVSGDRCARASNEYVVSFREPGDPPGVVQWADSVWVPATETGLSYDGHMLYQWDIPLVMPVILETGYLGVYGYGVSDCWFSWLTSGEGDGGAKSQVYEELPESGFVSHWLDLSTDFAYCLVTDPDACQRDTHSADQNADNMVSLSELLRVIQFYNSDGYCTAPVPGETEDGYVPGAGTRHATCPHSSDFMPPDWTINLSELLRLVQLYNVGGYHVCGGGEDGFCAGIT